MAYADPSDTNGSGILDELFGTVDKGVELWTKFQTPTQPTKVETPPTVKQPTPAPAFQLDTKTILIGVGIVAALALFGVFTAKK